MTIADDVTVTFLGITEGAELLGATQADFAIDRPRISAKEVSVLLNSPAAAMLAEHFGVENTIEFRERAAAEAGAAWLRYIMAKGQFPDSVTFLSKAMLDAEPEFLASLKA